METNNTKKTLSAHEVHPCVGLHLTIMQFLLIIFFYSKKARGISHFQHFQQFQILKGDGSFFQRNRVTLLKSTNIYVSKNPEKQAQNRQKSGKNMTFDVLFSARKSVTQL